MFIKLNLTGLDKGHLAMYVHEPGHEIGLYGNYWPDYVGYHRLLVQSQFDLPLEKEVYIYDADGDCEKSDEYDFAKCLLDFARRVYVEADCSNVCWFPQSLFITRTLDLRPCLTDEDTKCMTLHLMANVIEDFDAKEVTRCKKKCSADRYSYETREDATIVYEENVAFVFMLFESTTYSIFEEYVLYDENTIIAGVGGSLGLFLGFSCLQVVKSGTKFCTKRIQDKVKKSPDNNDTEIA